MPTPLRSIAVHVTEPETGAFLWALAELGADHTWSELQSADAPCPTYKEAMADGLLALQALVADLDSGPRTEPSGRHRARAPAHGNRRVQSEKDNEPAPDRDASPPRRSAFGFGLAN